MKREIFELEDNRLNWDNLFRIGSGWVFDTKDLVGYEVLYGIEAEDKLVKAYKITRGKGIDKVTCFGKAVPVGVVRKSIELLEFLENEQQK